MTIDGKKLIGLAVETVSGMSVGKVHSFALDTESMTVVQYEVRRSGLLGELLSPRELVIAAQQVRSLTNEKMVVDDLVVNATEKAGSVSPVAPSPSA